jgi:phosphoribosylglycinamide formyltransferase-1
VPDPARLAVLASGGGTNLQSLIDHFGSDGSDAASVELVVASRAGIGAIERAAAAAIDAVVLDARALTPGELAALMLTALEEHAIEVVVLAGYLQLVPAEVVARYRGRMLNIHPALLPAFGGRGMYGQRVHQAVLESGARVSGATVHLVDERYDEGAILAQWPVPVLPGDTPQTLAARVLRVEHALLPAAVESLAAELRDSDRAAPPTLAGEPAFQLTSGRSPAPEDVLRLIAPARRPPADR